jgi:predicted kinase
MKSKVILLVGPPLSGKDTYLKSQDYSDYVVISRDDILMSLHNTDDYTEAFNQVDQKMVDRILNNKIQDCIDGKKNVIINMTNLTKKGRNRHLSKFPNSDYEKIAIVFPKLDITEYINRNLKRKNEENALLIKSSKNAQAYPNLGGPAFLKNLAESFWFSKAKNRRDFD